MGRKKKTFDDTIPPLSPEKRKEIRKRIAEKHKKLLDEFKIKHAELYKWLVDHNVDFNNLHKYSKNIAAALALTNQLIVTNPQIAPVPTPTQTQVASNNNDTDHNLTDNDKRAREVWQKYGDIIESVAKKYDIDPQLIFATIMTESEGNPDAYRYEPHINDASYGLGQILYGSARNLGYTGTPEEMYRPEISIDLIGKYHKNTKDTYGVLAPEQMTVVYNTGKLYGYPYPGHLTRFKEWYYNYPKSIIS